MGLHPALLQQLLRLPVRDVDRGERAVRGARAKRASPARCERYLDLLKAGGSDYPYELVKTAGVDLATPAPYQALAARMNSIMDEIEAILARQKK